MRRLKKRWIKELDAALPELRDDVRACPLPKTQGEPKKQPLRRPLIYSLSALGSLACVLVICLAVIFGTPTDSPVVPDDTFKLGAVTVEINPSVAFLTDKDGTVTRVLSLNEDADVILSDSEREAALLNIPLADAVKTFVEYSAKSGYLSLTAPDAVRIRATADIEETWLDGSVLALENYFTEKNISAVVVSDMVEIDNFGLLLGLPDVQSKDDLATWAENRATHYIDSKIENIAPEDFAGEYRETVVDSIFKNNLSAFVESYVNDTLSLQQANLSMISYALCNYWEAEKNGIPPYAPSKEDAQALIIEMKEMLRLFEENYGIQIENADDLSEASALIGDLLSNFLTLWDADVLAALDMIEECGLSVKENVRRLLTDVPSDRESYLALTKEAYQHKYEELEKTGKAEFESEREEVDREKLHEDLLGEWGSLENFFENKEKMQQNDRDDCIIDENKNQKGEKP